MARRPVPSPPVARLSDGPLDETDVPGPWPHHLVEIDGVEINVRVTDAGGNDAEPALFVHGLGGSSNNWTDIAGLLRDRLDIEAIDLPGFGRSGPSRDGYRLEIQARLVVDYLVTSGRGPVHLVGNSMGGAVSILVATKRPDLVRSLTLISPAVADLKRLRFHPLRHDPWIGLIVAPFVGPAILRRARRIAPAIRAKMTIKLCFADPDNFPQRRMDEAVAEAEFRQRYPWSDRAMVRATRGLAWAQLAHSRAGWATLRRISAPTLVVWGDTDRLVAPDLAAHVAAAVSDGRLLMLAETGHTAQMERPVETARAILRLVEDVRGDTADTRVTNVASVTGDSDSAVAT